MSLKFHQARVLVAMGILSNSDNPGVRVREIGRLLGLSSPATVHHHIKLLKSGRWVKDCFSSGGVKCGAELTKSGWDYFRNFVDNRPEELVEIDYDLMSACNSLVQILFLIDSESLDHISLNYFSEEAFETWTRDRDRVRFLVKAMLEKLRGDAK